jgi:hypothetical protein
MALLFPTTPTPGQQYIAPNGITYTWDNTLGVWTGGAGGGSTVTAASLAEAAAGTINTKYSSPETAVPKNASGMTGAAIIPSGTDAQRAAIAPLVVGMQRYNTTVNFEEVYTGAVTGWKKLAWYSTPAASDLTWSGAVSANSVYIVNNFTVNAGTTVTPAGAGTYIYCLGTATINASTWNFEGKGGSGAGIIFANAGAFAFGGPGNGPSAGIGPTEPAFSTPPGYLVGSGGGGGTCFSGGGAGPGGDGGGYIYIQALGGITLSAGVTMNVFGTNGAAGTGNAGGSGGGSGGNIILQSDGPIATPAGVVFNAYGGNGGNGTGGGDGAGGGGGGWIILESPLLTDASTKNLSGGLAGSRSGAGGNPGGGGGGGAGTGGLGGYATYGTASNGSPGIYTNLFK